MAKEDMDLASLLWGEKEVTKYICASGVFSQDDIKNRLSFEINNMEKTNVQYWPIFDISDGELIGCCGLRPYKNEKGTYEIGCHLRSKYWRQGYAFEGVKKVIDYAFNELKATRIFAGHHPDNNGSRMLLRKFDFIYIGDEYYGPTGLYHPSYEMIRK